MNNLPAYGGHIHLIAICGVGMAALAGLLQSLGYRVTGSDAAAYPPMSTYLDGLGIKVQPGYHSKHLEQRPDLVVVGNAVSRDNPEVQAVLEKGISTISFPQALRMFLIGSKKAVVVAGTHGKTSTTSLLAWVLSQAKLDPSFFIGGLPLNFDSGFQLGGGPWAVLEGDEYDSAFFDKGPKFLHYEPQKVILTSLEFDHADIYSDLQHMVGAFQRLVNLIPSTGTLVVSNQYEAAGQVAHGASCPVIYYGEGSPAGWVAKDVRVEEGRVRFEPWYKKSSEGTVTLSQFGRHNVDNALGVYVMARELGIKPNIIRKAMTTFSGVTRRQELKGEVGGVTLIDDFAHHPTAVRETIAGVKMNYPGRRLWAIFEPRSQTSRRRIFENEFAKVLAEADRVIVAGLYQPEKIPENDRLSPGEVVNEIGRLCGDSRAVTIERADEIATYVVEQSKSGDVILVMSNGGFDKVQDKILNLLKEGRLT